MSNTPDITFVDSNTSAIEAEMIASYEAKIGRVLYPADPMKLVILYAASVISQERAIFNDAAKQNVPRYARGEYLDNLCELFKDVQRLEAQPATVQLEFTISEAQQTSVIIPAGTRASVDGNIMFATDTDMTVPAGNLTASCSATCTIPGTMGNGYGIGQISQCVDIFPYFLSVTNITESNGGSDREDDEALYHRMRDSMESYSTAGPAGSYIYHAKSASTVVTDVTATSPSPGVVDIRILCANGVLPEQELLDTISAALNDEKVRPLTDKVTVSAPTASTFDIDVTYYVTQNSGLSLVDAEAAVKAAIDKYVAWQTAKIGRDINPSYLIQLIMETGVKRVNVMSPVYTTVSDTEAAQLGTTTINNGGYEDA